MNTPDTLDKTIDALLASQPLKPNADFTERVLTAADEQAAREIPSKTLRVQWLRRALPIAALFIAAFVGLRLISDKPVESNLPMLSTIEVQEIFILEEGLTGLASLQDDDLSSQDLLDTFIFFNSQT